MCEYCDNKYGNLALWNDCYRKCVVNKFGVVYINGVYDFDELGENFFTLIKYCPMCGRNLIPENLYAVKVRDEDDYEDFYFFDSLDDAKSFIMSENCDDCECVYYEIDSEYIFEDSSGVVTYYNIIKIL